MCEGETCRSKSAVVEEDDEPIMERMLYEAAREGNIESFLDLVKAADAEKNTTDAHHSKEASTSSSTKEPVHYLFRRTPARNNILHVSLLYYRFEFTQAAASEMPQLIMDVNVDGNNPLHIAAQTGSAEVIEGLVKSHQMHCEKLKAQGKDVIVVEPWRAKNKDGNTPLHVALIHGMLKVACYLIQLDHQLVRVRNNFKETPLHLAVRHRFDDELHKIEAVMKLLARNQVINDRISICELETDSVEVVKLLLEKDHSVACWRDDKGLTPLLTAITIKPSSSGLIFAILNYCPESVEVCDNLGNSFLHFLSMDPSLDAYLFESEASIAIKNMRNKEGDTPVHLAVRHHNIVMTGLLIKSSANFAIKNKDGISAAALIQEQSEDFRNDLQKWVRMNIHSNAMLGGKYSDEEMRALLEMDWVSLKEKMMEYGESFFQKQNAYSNNILHIFAKGNPRRFGEDEFEEFISKVLLTSPALICQPDFIGRNCLHLLLKTAPNLINKRILEMIARHFKTFQREGFLQKLCYDPPWKAKDQNGDTLLHIALDPTLWNPEISWVKYIECAMEIMQFDPQLAEEEDKNGEMPLHRLLIRGCLPQVLNEDETAKKKLRDQIKFIINRSFPALQKPDREGLTPLLRAAKNKDIQFILQLDSRNSLAQDSKGNTYLHLLADMRLSEDESRLFEESSFFLHNCFVIIGERNEDGNTPLHLAVMHSNFELAHTYLKALTLLPGNTIAGISTTTNNDGNTLLHVAAGNSGSPLAQSFIKQVYDCSLEDVLITNRDGNTAMHLAVLKDDFELATVIFDMFGSVGDGVRQILLKCDKDQNTPLHLAILEGKFRFIEKFLEIGEKAGCITDILLPSNKDQNTALHLAIRKSYFEHARKFIECAATNSRISEMLAIPNANNETPGRLIGSDSHLPAQFENFFWSEPKVVEAMLGVRSLSGVSTNIIKEYTNTIGVIAALFATITFTAAFTVPGGLNSNTGTPLLMQKPAFQVFLVSDIIAMCLSMMVLFFLMWIMTINDDKHQVILLDLTVFSLQGAFYTTIFTFMMGLYITVSSTALWIAILACVLCSMLILLMHKRFIMWFIPSFIQIYVWFRRGYYWIKKLCGDIIACCGCNENQRNGEQSQISRHANDPTGVSEAVVNMN